MAKRIIFACGDCSEPFTVDVDAFIAEPADEVLAPVLCEDCGHGAEDREG